MFSSNFTFSFLPSRNFPPPLVSRFPIFLHLSGLYSTPYMFLLPGFDPSWPSTVLNHFQVISPKLNGFNHPMSPLHGLLHSDFKMKLWSQEYIPGCFWLHTFICTVITDSEFSRQTRRAVVGEWTHPVACSSSNLGKPVISCSHGLTEASVIGPQYLRRGWGSNPIAFWDFLPAVKTDTFDGMR